MLSHQDNNDGLELEEAQSRGVKEDLFELKQTLTRQLYGVASFLAPPPPSSSSQLQPSSPFAHSDLHRLHFDDSTEISTKMNADSFGSEMESKSDLEERGFGGARITDEVLAFARNIGMPLETWLDFPIDEEEDLDCMCIFSSSSSSSSSLDSNQQPKSQCLNFLKKQTKIIYIIGL